MVTFGRALLVIICLCVYNTNRVYSERAVTSVRDVACFSPITIRALDTR